MVDITKKFKLICKSIPTYKLCDDIGVDAETTYILDLTTEEKYNLANDYLQENCSTYEPIDKRFIGKKVIMEMDSNGDSLGYWCIIHGDIDEYLAMVRNLLKNHNVNNPYWRIPENTENLKYCPYCGKEIRVVKN